MTVLVYVLVRFVSVLLFALEILMMARVIMSWLPLDDEAPLIRFLYVVTEPFVMPVRNLLERSETIASMPFDLSFMVTYLILILVQMFLPSVSL